MSLVTLENGTSFTFALFKRSPYVLAISWSTQAVSLMIFDPLSGPVAYVDVPFKDLSAYNMPMGYHELDNGMVYTSPNLFLEALDRGLSEIVNTVGESEIARIAFVTGNVQQHGVAFLRPEFQRTVAKLDSSKALHHQLDAAISFQQWPIWKSAHTDAQCQLISDALGGAEEVAKRTGSVATRRFSLPLWLEFAMNQPEAYADTGELTQFSGFATALFASGSGPLELGNGLGSNAITHHGVWCDEVFQSLSRVVPDMRDKLPAVTHSLAIAGKISSYFVERFGFSPSTQVLPFTGDNPESALGTGLYSPTQAQAAYSFGTSLTKFRVVDSSITHVTTGQGHIFGSVTGGNLMLVCHANGMGLADALRQELKFSWQQMRDLLGRTAAGNDGVWGLILPERECTPPTSRAIQLTTDDQRFSTDPAVRYRTLCESQACLIALSAELPGNPSEVIATGGASGDRAFLQIVADVTQKRIRASEAEDTATLGSALRASRLTSPDLTFAKLTSRYCKLGEVITPKVGPEFYREQLAWYRARLDEVAD
jgi:xylulokinase